MQLIKSRFGASNFVLVLLLSALADASMAQQGVTINPAKIHVVSSATGAPVPEAYVLLYANGQDPMAAISDNQGVVTFPQLVIPPAVNNIEQPVSVTVLVNCLGFLPSKRSLRFSEHERSTGLPLVPEDTGYKSEVIKASSGGKFELEGLGTLDVAPGALTQDVSLRIVPVPMVSWSHGLISPDAGVMRHQVWLGAYDVGGHPAPGALPSVLGGITLQTALPFRQAPMAGATNETWSVYAFGINYQQSVVAGASILDKDHVSMALAGGHNALVWNYSVLGQDGCGHCAWWIEWDYVSSRKVPMSGAAVHCGRFTSAAKSEIEKGEQRSTTMSISAQAAMEVGFEVGVGVSKLVGKQAYTLSGSVSGTTCTTTASSSEASIGPSHTIDGKPDTLGPGDGYKCVNAQVVVGEIYRTYRVFAKRTTVCVVGGQVTFGQEQKLLGTIEVFHMMGKWFEGPDPQNPNPVWSIQCPGCNPAGPLPELPQDW